MTASYSIILRSSARDQLRGIPKHDVHKIGLRIDRLAFDPRPLGCQKLSGELGYRVRQGDYRILYIVDDETRVIEVYKIGHRSEVYR